MQADQKEKKLLKKREKENGYKDEFERERKKNPGKRNREREEGRKADEGRKRKCEKMGRVRRGEEGKEGERGSRAVSKRQAACGQNGQAELMSVRSCRGKR